MEGIPSVLIGVSVLFYLDDGIRNAHWLTEAEQNLLADNLQTEVSTKHHLSVDLALYLIAASLFLGALLVILLVAKALIAPLR